MSLYKTEAVVLKSIRLGEADRVVTLFTKTKGRVSAVVKGVRRTRSKFGCRVELISRSHFLLYKGRNLDIVTQAELINPYTKIKSDFDRFTHGSAMIDLVNKVSVEEVADIALYSILLKALEVLSEAHTGARLLLGAFDLKVMAASGYLPRLEACVICDSNANSDMKFSFGCGGLLCGACSPIDNAGVSLSEPTRDLMAKLLNAPFEEIAKLKPPARVEKESFLLIQNYVAYHVQSRLKSRDYLTS